MNIKKIINSALLFIVNRLIEIFGISLLIFGFLLLVALISHSPDDPNFIFPENTNIENLLGVQGSFVSHIFFQSIGFISYLIPITLIFTGLNIFTNKKILLLINNIFFVILYSLLGSLFFSYFYYDSFYFYTNGNGGFVGNYLNSTFINNIIIPYESFFYYLLILIIIFLFLLSVNFNLRKIIVLFKKIFSGKNKKNYTNENEIINEYIPQDEIKNLIQDDLPFINAKTKKHQKN